VRLLINRRNTDPSPPAKILKRTSSPQPETTAAAPGSRVGKDLIDQQSTGELPLQYDWLDDNLTTST